MKISLSLFFFISYMNVYAQNTETADPGNFKAPYSLATPQGWGTERFAVPISFAPEISYSGIEDVRFTPGWADIKTAEYWSYAFLWYLDGKQDMTAEIIEKNLKAYYTGLFDSNTKGQDISKKEMVKVKTKIEAVSTAGGDEKTFNGLVVMTDYMKLEPITLNFIIHLRSCPGEDKTFVFYEASPMPYTDKVWESLNYLWTGFKCDLTSGGK